MVRKLNTVYTILEMKWLMRNNMHYLKTQGYIELMQPKE